MSEGWEPDKVRVQVARDLREIVRLWRLLPEEAAEQGAGRDAGSLDALNLAGPAANLEAWQHRFETAEALDRDTGYASDQTAELHPLLVLATWEDAVRDERDQPTDLRATVERAADYLRDSIDWMLGTNEWGDLNFIAIDQLAEDLRRCRRMLEDVTREGVRDDKGVPCMICGTNLVKIWGDVADEDRWLCRPCDRWSTTDQYHLAVKADARRSADRLTARDMLEEYRIKPGTLRQWATRGHVRKRGRDASGRMLYDVDDALRVRGVADDEVSV